MLLQLKHAPANTTPHDPRPHSLPPPPPPHPCTAAELCKDEPEWRDLAGDEERRALFEEHLEKLKVRPGRGLAGGGAAPG